MPHYDKAYSGTFFKDYENMYVLDFISRVYASGETINELCRLRNIVLNVGKTKDNERDYDNGLTVLNSEQKRYLKEKKLKGRKKSFEQLNKLETERYMRELSKRKGVVDGE